MSVASPWVNDAAADGRVDGREFRAADGHEDEENAEDESGVADPVDDERFFAGIGRRGLFEPEADQKIGTEPDAFPADEHQDHVRGQDQDEHGEGEEVQVGEIARVSLVMGHVADGIEMDEKADAGDDKNHDGRERVELERKARLRMIRL